MGTGGFIINGMVGMRFRGGYLTSLVGVINISSREPNLWLNMIIRDNNNIKTGINISRGGVQIGDDKSNTFTGDVNIKGDSALYIGKSNGAIAISGNMNVKDGAKVVSYRTGQIAKHVRVSLESSGTNASRLLLEYGVQESFRELNVDGKGIVEFQYNSKLILDELNVGLGDSLTVLNWKNGKNLFLVRKTSTHIKNSLSHIIFQGQSGRVHLEDYNKDYWGLTTAPEPATTSAIVVGLGLGIAAHRRRRRILNLRCGG